MFKIVLQRRVKISCSVLLLALCGTVATFAQSRVLGLDVSAHQGNLAETNWATIARPTNEVVDGVYGDGRHFVFIRSSRGGTTGEDHRQGGYPSGDTYYSLSQRYDDPYYVQNITRATDAGLMAGTYHFARPDVIETTTRSGGIANTGADEADHMMQMASAWMRPGYLLPVFDLEAGMTERTTNGLADFCVAFSDRIYQVMGIRPIMYINGNYSRHLESATNPTALVTAFPKTWDARYIVNDNPSSTAYRTGHPKDSASTFYGPWDNPPNPTHPWSFWQYASQAGRLNGYKNATTAIDLNVAQGGIEFLKDHLVPAVWLNDSTGLWTTLTAWNSGKAPAAPVVAAGQLPRVGPLVLPPQRLPGSNDTVSIDRPNTNITVIFASGSHNVRKLYNNETLNISGGALTVNYVPTADSTPFSAQFSGPVSLTGFSSFSVHTVRVTASNTFTLGGGTLAFDTITLMPDSNSPAMLQITGVVEMVSLSNSTMRVANGPGTGNAGRLNLGGAIRPFNISTGIVFTADVTIQNGALMKQGAGTMQLLGASIYAGGTTVAAGQLEVNNTTGSGTGTGAVAVNGSTLRGTGIIGGPVTVNAGGKVFPGTDAALGTLTLGSVPTLNGATVMRIDRNGGTPVSDKLVLSSGTLVYGGTLVVSNVGAAVQGGDVFTNFSAASYSGAFASSNLPALSAGLNWYLGKLSVDGTLRVNNGPYTNTLVTISYPVNTRLQIPRSMLIASVTDADGDSLALTGFSGATTNGVILQSDATYIYYSNSVGVVDRFYYTVGDGRGGSVQGVVKIEPSLAGRFVSHPTGTGSSLTLYLSGVPGSTYYLERSTNLVSWQSIWTNVAPSPSGTFNYTDNFQGLSSPLPPLFYRLKLGQ